MLLYYLSSSIKKIETLHIEKMLEEKNDNLLEADGNLEHNSVESTQLEPEVLATETSDIVATIPA